MASSSENQYKLLARSGNQVQEVKFCDPIKFTLVIQHSYASLDSI